jgi:hypothetical protein
MRRPRPTEAVIAIQKKVAALLEEMEQTSGHGGTS